MIPQTARLNGCTGACDRSRWWRDNIPPSHCELTAIGSSSSSVRARPESSTACVCMAASCRRPCRWSVRFACAGDDRMGRHRHGTIVWRLSRPSRHVSRHIAHHTNTNDETDRPDTEEERRGQRRRGAIGCENGTRRSRARTANRSAGVTTPLAPPPSSLPLTVPHHVRSSSSSSTSIHHSAMSTVVGASSDPHASLEELGKGNHIYFRRQRTLETIRYAQRRSPCCSAFRYSVSPRSLTRRMSLFCMLVFCFFC
jgi:hypothetical protein